MTATNTYSRQKTRGQSIKQGILQLLHVVMEKLSKEHLERRQKQLVVFSFDHVAHYINLLGVYEKDQLDLFFEWASSCGVSFAGSTALDIGANIGNHSLYFSDLFGSVVSFEPNPRTFQVLKLNSQLAGNVVCHNFGLSSRAASVNLYLDPNNIGGASVTRRHSGQISHPIKLVALDEFGALSNVKLIKIDVEGHELEALTGGSILIEKNKPIVLFEQHPRDFANGQSPVVEFLQRLGYKRFAIFSHTVPLSGSTLNRVLFAPFRRIVMGDSIKISVVSDLPPNFYPFVIALPDWFPGPYHNRPLLGDL